MANATPNVLGAATSFFQRAERAGITEILLYSASGMDPAIVATFDDVGTRDAKDLAHEAVEYAQSDAAGKSGILRYELVAQKKTGQAWGRQSIALDAGKGDFEREDADLRGLVVECIRDRRESQRMCLNFTEGLIGKYAQQLETYAVQLAHANDNQLKIIELVERLQSEALAREISMRKAAVSERNQERMVETFIPIVPALANRLMGSGSNGAKKEGGDGSPEEKMIIEFLDSLSAEQVLKMGGALALPQQAAIMEINQAKEQGKVGLLRPAVESFCRSLNEKQVEEIVPHLTDRQRDLFFAIASGALKAGENEQAKVDRKIDEMKNGKVPEEAMPT